ncbi:MAG: retron St85 family RNA-directed DNA polymerase [Candidatus Dadabacteria bacterium]|nr:retron St85 family RNA-directed DNA polymerase [Candidatus Dadabacteria bacterium]
MDIEKKISADLDIPSDLIDEAVAASRSQVKKFYINKRGGNSRRAIYQPAKKIKTIQYWLMANVFKELPVHLSSAAYIKGESILSNAKRHRKNRYFLKMDFKDFFPSIKWRDFRPIIKAWYEKTTPDWKLTVYAENLIRQTCFYLNDSLPIGYPSSPMISNAVMFTIDNDIENLLSDHDKYGNVIYTRYADDLVISTNKKHVCKDIYKAINEIIKKTKSPNLSLNPEKTRVGSSTSGSALVTGLRICSNEHITIHRKHKDHIRLLLSLYKKKQLEQDEQMSLLGHLAYVRHVAPQFYSKLQNKYFKEIVELKSSNKQ